MRILLTLFCILPLTIDTAFAALKWDSNFCDGEDCTKWLADQWDKNKNNLDVCKHTNKIVENTTRVYEQDKTGGWCTPKADDGYIKITEVIGICANSNNQKQENISFYNGNNKRCYCRILAPYVSKYWYHLQLYDNQDTCNTRCGSLCRNVALEKSKITKPTSPDYGFKEDDNSTFYESTSVSCSKNPITINYCSLSCPNGGCYVKKSQYSYKTDDDEDQLEGINACDSVISEKFVALDGSNWISGSCNKTTVTGGDTVVHYYQTISDATGEYYCISDNQKKPSDYSGLCE